MNNLKSKFTSLQIKKLNEANIYSIYDLVTYLPYDLMEVTPLVSSSYYDQKKTYLWEGILTNMTIRKGRQRFFVLEFEGESKLSCYLFNSADYIFKALKVGVCYQLLLKYNNGFWSIDKFAAKKYSASVSNFVLGQAESRDYLLPKYSKLKSLNTQSFSRFHQKLSLGDYRLDLQGLVPENNILPLIIDLNNIHHPTDRKSFIHSKQLWVSLRVYLRLSLMRYQDLKQSRNLAIAGNLNINFLKKMSRELPFELSLSQKQVIWDILKEITFVD